jgi:hypothetical protein
LDSDGILREGLFFQTGAELGAKFISILLKFRAAPYAVGILASTASTYILFLVFSITAAPDSLGLFALWSGIAAIVVQLIDGVSAQRIAQAHRELSSLSHRPDSSLNFLNPFRFALLVSVSLFISLLVLVFDASKFASFFVLVVGQGSYALSVSSRVFGHPLRLLGLQLFNCAVFLVVAVLCFLLVSNPTADSLMLLAGIASLAASVPCLVRDVISRSRMDIPLGMELRTLYLGKSWKHLLGLVAYQGVNACGGAVDTLMTALGGLRTSAEYQVIRRPMLALGSLNAAVGQHALNRYAKGSSVGWSKALIQLAPVLVMWPLLGVGGLVVVRWVTPDDYEVSTLAGVLLAVSFALSAFLQVTGTVILVRNRTFTLIFASV